jgi:putative DNA primase/helicase
VARDPKLVGPSGLFILTIAESGERKSTCDGHFTAPLREWERDEAERLRPAVEAADRERSAWTAKRAGDLEAIKNARRKAAAVDTAELEARLAVLGPEPAGVPIPSLMTADATPEGLAHSLANEWPSTGLLASEAGVVFGSHGMGSDTVMRNLALLNVLWDGGEVRVKRRTVDSFTARGRLTVGLMTQPATFRAFLEKTGELVRGTGFLARFLLCEPASTQGERFYREPPTEWPALERFHARLRVLLSQALPLDDGMLRPPALPFTIDGKAEWISAHDAVEHELRAGGDCEDVRDVASKTLDNAARLAGLFHLLERGPAGAIGADYAARGVKLAIWHLGEARRLLAGVVPPVRSRNAERLETWLVERHRTGERLGTREARQFGPIREAAPFAAALEVLKACCRARVVEVGRQRLVLLNPALPALIEWGL